MRVVLDTNILFSALISPHGAPDAIYRAWRASRFEVVTFRTKGHPPIYAVFATAAHDIPHPIDRLQHRLRRQVRVVSTT